MHIFNVEVHKIPLGDALDFHTRRSQVALTQSQLQPSTLNLSLRFVYGCSCCKKTCQTRKFSKVFETARAISKHVLAVSTVIWKRIIICYVLTCQKIANNTTGKFHVLRSHRETWRFSLNLYGTRWQAHERTRQTCSANDWLMRHERCCRSVHT